MIRALNDPTTTASNYCTAGSSASVSLSASISPRARGGGESTASERGWHGGEEARCYRHGGAGPGAAHDGLPDRGGVAVAALRPAPGHRPLLPALQGAARRRVRAAVGGPGQHGRAHGVRLPPRRRRAPRHQPLPQRRPRRRRPRSRRPRPPRPLHPGVGGEAVEDGPVGGGEEGPADRRVQGHAALQPARAGPPTARRRRPQEVRRHHHPHQQTVTNIVHL